MCERIRVVKPKKNNKTKDHNEKKAKGNSEKKMCKGFRLSDLDIIRF